MDAVADHRVAVLAVALVALLGVELLDELASGVPMVSFAEIAEALALSAAGLAGALLFGAHVVGVQRDLMLTMFGSGQVTDAHNGRFNVLLLGGDSGAGRWGLRPDSLTVASIDEVTGRTVLVSLPRNMQNFPFAEGSVMAEQFPDGFDADYLNGVSTWAQDNTELFEGSDNPGIDATISAVEGITGLQINYWAMVNLQGFKDLVDAVGGIEICPKMAMKDPQANLDVKKGCQEADGKTALGYARSRKLYTGLGDIHVVSEEGT